MAAVVAKATHQHPAPALPGPEIKHRQKSKHRTQRPADSELRPESRQLYSAAFKFDSI
jgi:hypothetical protein